MYRHALLLAFVPAIALIFGCSPAPQTAPPPVAVKGTVTRDGKPMASGEIRFGLPGFPAKIMEIKDGAFSGEASVGKNQVEVVHMKDEGFTTTEPKAPIKVNTISDKYSGPRSVLSAEVSKGGVNDFKFEVTSK